jgi:hypothetical protein
MPMKHACKRLENKIAELLRLSPMDLLARKGEVDHAEKSTKILPATKSVCFRRSTIVCSALAKILRTLRDNLNRAEKTYVVGTWSRDRDCLWNIAKKPDIYGDAFKWPKIWQKNRDQIKNPDIIYPGQVLRFPAPAPLTIPKRKALHGATIARNAKRKWVVAPTPAHHRKSNVRSMRLVSSFRAPAPRFDRLRFRA